MADGEDPGLTDLLNETRILLPGTEIFLGFLATLPFTDKFGALDGPRRTIYVCTFVATVLALVLFVVPATYHRIARPIHHKVRFKAFASGFLVAGLLPTSVAVVLATYLVTYTVLDGVAVWVAGAVALLIVAVWWTGPILRVHDRLRGNREGA